MKTKLTEDINISQTMLLMVQSDGEQMTKRKLRRAFNFLSKDIVILKRTYHNPNKHNMDISDVLKLGETKTKTMEQITVIAVNRGFRNKLLLNKSQNEAYRFFLGRLAGPDLGLDEKNANTFALFMQKLM